MRRLRLPSFRLPFGTETLTRWGARLTLATLVVLAGILLVGFVRMTWTEHKINQQAEQQRAINEQQQRRNDTLKGEAEFRESDVYAEQAAREQLGMAREGETVLLPTVVPAPSAAPAPPPTPEPAAVGAAPAAEDEPIEARERPNYARWWYALFPGANVRP